MGSFWFMSNFIIVWYIFMTYVFVYWGIYINMVIYMGMVVYILFGFTNITIIFIIINFMMYSWLIFFSLFYIIYINTY